MNTSTAKYWLLLIGILAAGYGSFVFWRWGSSRPLGTVVTVARSGASPAQAPPAQASSAQASSAQASSTPSSGPIADFELIDQNGEQFDSTSLQGKVWVASFFFTNCPSACWRMNQALSAYQQTHPDSTARFVSITCDPDNDTPAALTTYAEHFKADPDRWTFLTGDMQRIEKIGQDSFKISVVKKVHSDRACVVDRTGQVRGSFRLTEPEQVKMLEQLLAVVEAEPADAGESAQQPGEDASRQDVPDAEHAAPPAAASS